MMEFVGFVECIEFVGSTMEKQWRHSGDAVGTHQNERVAEVSLRARNPRHNALFALHKVKDGVPRIRKQVAQYILTRYNSSN